MFERTISICRRILGGQPSAGDATSTCDERRHSERYPSDQVVSYSVTLSSSDNGPQRKATTQNVSAGGISLLVTESHKPGELLSIQLPRLESNTPVFVLACVVHSRRVDHRTHIIGCTFARELSSEDLACFGAQLDPPQEEFEMRHKPRYMCNLEAGYQVIDDGTEETHSAKVLNISTTGVGLAIAESLPVGTLINVELNHVDDRDSKNLLCCVVHASGQDDRECLIGCNFITELKETEFKSLLHQ